VIEVFRRMLVLIMQLLRSFCALATGRKARPDEMAVAPHHGVYINCSDLEEDMLGISTHMDAPEGAPAVMSHAAAPAGPSLLGSDAAPVNATEIFQGHHPTSARAAV
jgi:hypothetical protein